jgi:DNA-binding winged helix-turn-helix (wHTH) protein/tetratricopeptide (TPR) repeat protein
VQGPEATYRFGQFRIEPSQRRLLRNGEPVALTAKAFDVLLTLIRNSGRLVTKQTLLSAVWPDVVVDDSNLTFTVSILRKALGEPRTGQRYIETVPKQGYRFVAPLQPATPEQSPIESFACVVERDHQLRVLMDAFGRAQSGKPQVRFISGEAGLGKTTLVRIFESSVQQTGRAVFAIGTCIDHQSQSEPYFPVFEALGKMALSDSRELLLQCLRVHAPTWMARMPALRGETQEVSGGQGQERMLRELEDVFIELARNTTLVIVLEDLQWCDSSTVDIVARVARIVTPARLLLIGTWRPSEARARTHPIDALIRDLCFRSPECLVSVELLTRAGIEEMLSRRFDTELALRVAPVLYGRTEGNPLFIHAVLHDWSESGKLRWPDGDWNVDAATLSADVPSTLRDFILQQTAALPQSQREVLEAASIARPQIWLRVIAAALERPIGEVEESTAALVRTGLMFRRAGVFDYPNGELGEAFEFTHSLYPEVIASAVPPGRCVRLHQSVGEFLERAFGACIGTIAGSLAGHFRAARDPRRAIRYLIVAAERTSLDGAPREAVSSLDEALGLLTRLPDSAEREEAELRIQSLRGPLLVATDGFASCAAETSLRRALHLAGRCGTDREIPAAFGLAAVLEVRGEYQSSQTLLEQYLPAPGCDSRYAAEWHHLLACSTFHQGQFAVALDHALCGLKVAPADGHSELLRDYGEHPRVECHTWAALALWFLGFPDQSLAHAEQAASIVETPRHGYAMANGSAQLAMVHQLRREIHESLARAQATVDCGKTQGMPYRVAIGKAVAGWACAQLGAAQEGIRQIREAIEICDRIGANLDRPYFLALLADALICCEEPEEAERAVVQALEQVRRSRSFFYEAELLRLQAVACAHRKNDVQAKEIFSIALQTATAQGARALELTALVSMVRRYPSDPELRVMLQSRLASFSEGFHLPDLRSAASLSGSAVAVRS